MRITVGTSDRIRMDVSRLTRALQHHAHQLGFDWVRIAPAAAPPHIDFYDLWATPERTGEMSYLARNLDRRRDPRLLSDEADLRSIIVLGVNYHQFALPDALRDDPSRGVIAAYAWGDDYHELIKPQLYALDAFIASQSGRSTRGKCLVDTGPVLERDWAAHAGIGFTGKNCCTIRPGAGSWFFLATVMVPEVLAYDPPPAGDVPPFAPADVLAGLAPAAETGRWEVPVENGARTGTCGQCTRCLHACPTDAFVGPFHLDPQRCISYWTIEAQAPIPETLRPHFGNRIFGCDICQEVCPWNQRLPVRTPRLLGLAAQAARVAPPLLDGFDRATPYWIDEDAFAAHFRRSPIKRAKRRGMLRNVCVALGNWADPVGVPALTTALHDPEPLPRGHAAWALGRVLARHRHDAARRALSRALDQEDDVWVRGEISRALNPNTAARETFTSV